MQHCLAAIGEFRRCRASQATNRQQGQLQIGNADLRSQFVSAADITAGKLKFSPAANANGAGYASFTFQVQDDGGTAHSGGAVDQTADTRTIDVTSVNDAPASTNNTVSVLEDGSYTFAAADF